MIYFGIAKKKMKFNHPFGFVEFEPDPMIFKDYETSRDDKLKFIVHPNYGAMLNAPMVMFVSNVTA